MKLLLDTQALIWWDSEPHRLSHAARTAIADPANDVWFGVASVWEMVIKLTIGKLSLRTPLDAFVTDQQAGGFVLLNVLLDHVLGVQALPLLQHRDPFDRLIVAQAITEGATLVTADTKLRQYPVPIIW